MNGDTAACPIQHRRDLAQVRRDRGVTQVDLAFVLGWTQSSVSRFEHQDDARISTVRAYVEALGGSLVIGAVFADDNSYHRIRIGSTQVNTDSPVTP